MGPRTVNAVQPMKVWPFGAALLQGGFKPPHAAAVERLFVVSDEEKAPDEVSGGDQEGERK